MAQTSFRSDDSRIKKELEMSTYAGRYHLNVAGPGDQINFFEDPQIRLQRFGANARTNTIGVEDDLMGRNRQLSRHYVGDTYESKAAISKAVSYGSNNPFILESRASNPSWTLRGVDQHYQRFEEPWLNPQANLEKNFQDNIQTRLQEKSISETENLNSFNWLPKV
jgi:hypothetical protein